MWLLAFKRKIPAIAVPDKESSILSRLWFILIFEKLACSCTDADSTNVVYLFGTPRVTTDDTNPTYT
jgi:hypothetical protein